MGSDISASTAGRGVKVETVNNLLSRFLCSCLEKTTKILSTSVVLIRFVTSGWNLAIMALVDPYQSRVCNFFTACLFSPTKILVIKKRCKWCVMKTVFAFIVKQPFLPVIPQVTQAEIFTVEVMFSSFIHKLSITH